MSLEPTNIQQIGNELAIQWNDGKESYLNLEFLRRACPCAACGGEPDVLGNVIRSTVTYSAESFVLQKFNVIGSYALQLHWVDGHNTGIYSFQYVRRLASDMTEKMSLSSEKQVGAVHRTAHGRLRLIAPTSGNVVTA
jgi:DUF971 family protein